jgi:hypothetical protein
MVPSATWLAIDSQDSRVSPGFQPFAGSELFSYGQCTTTVVGDLHLLAPAHTLLGFLLYRLQCPSVLCVTAGAQPTEGMEPFCIDDKVTARTGRQPALVGERELDVLVRPEQPFPARLWAVGPGLAAVHQVEERLLR